MDEALSGDGSLRGSAGQITNDLSQMGTSSPLVAPDPCPFLGPWKRPRRDQGEWNRVQPRSTSREVDGRLPADSAVHAHHDG